MSDSVQTWHYGLMARHWAEHNTTGPEIAYFQQQIEKYGQPALDAGCGTGRLLIPFLRASLDVDGCDVSGDMLMYCQTNGRGRGAIPPAVPASTAQSRSAAPVPDHCGLWRHRRRHRPRAGTLWRCSVSMSHLLPGGMLIFNGVPAYADAALWPLWRKDALGHSARALAGRHR